MTEFEQEMLAALHAIRDTLGDIRRDLSALRSGQEAASGNVQEHIVGGSANFSNLTQNKILPKRLG